MALTVGELVGTITLDADGVRSGLNDAETQLRTAGQQMGDDADRVGQHAGQQLGDGITRGADGRLRDIRGRFVTAGQQAGQGLGDGVRRSSGDVDDAAGDAGDRGGESFMQRMRGRASSGVSDVAGSIREGLSSKLALATVGAAAGAALMSAMSEAMEQGKITGRLGAQLGATAPEARRYGHIAGQLYADAVTEDFQGAADAISAVMRAGIAPPDATNAQIQSIATNVTDLANTFELDLGQTANAVGQMIKTGLAKDGVEAVDALTAGLQKMGPRADDIADTFNEYSTVFRQMGISATDATGLLSQGMKAGARDTDVVADSLKEFVLIAQGGGKEVDAAFKKIHLSGKEMQAAFTKGGPEAKAALDKVFDGLRKIKDPAERSALAVALFGTKAEDTQKALFSLDPSKATDTLGKVGGAADRMGDSLRDNAATKVEQFKRGIQQGVVDFLGTKVIPAMDGFKSFMRDKFGGIWAEAGKAVDGGNLGDKVVAAFGILGQRLLHKLPELASQAIHGLIGFGQKVADYIISNPMQVLKIAAIAGAIIMAIAYLPALISGAITATGSLIIVGLVSKLVTATNENLPRWWATVTGWISARAGEAGTWMAGLGMAIGGWFASLWSTYVSGPVSSTWDSFISSVSTLPGRTIGALASLGVMLAAAAARGFTAFKNSAAARASAFVSWVAGLPGRISRAVGSLTSLLTSKGRNVVTGLWNGIKAMGGWIKNKIIGWAKSVIPGPVAKALGISSPSKVMANQVGRWIPAGIAAGVEQHSGVLDTTMANLVTTPTPTAAYAGAMGAAVSGGSSAAGGGAGMQTVRLTAGDALGDQIIGIIRQQVGVGGGDVQVVLSGRR